jgi:hypothetical protein
MSISLGAGDAQLSSGEYASALLVELQFADGSVYLSTLPQDKQVDGIDWQGLDRHLRVEVITTSEDGRPSRIKLSVPIVNQDVLAYALGSVAGYRGRRVSIWMQVFTPTFVPVGTRKIEWFGYMEPVSISRKAGGQGGDSGRIELPCNRAGQARSRAAQGLRVTDAQQQARYPGDLGCQYTQTLIEQPSTWLSKRFQEVAP